jgi:hypothetical protein
MITSATFSGGGFLAGGAVSAAASLLVMTLVFPIASFVMSAYDGTLFALIAATILLLLVYSVSRVTPLNKSEGVIKR